jgi:hypothetical protein
MTSHNRWGGLERVEKFLSNTKNLILTIGAIASAVAAVLALTAGKSEESVLDADISGVQASEVSLNQFDARADGGEVLEGSAQTAKTGAVVYRLLADTLTTTVTHSTTPPVQGLSSSGQSRTTNTSITTTSQESSTSHNTSTGSSSSTQSGTPSLQQGSAAAAAAATSLRYVPGARIESGSETSGRRIAEVLRDLPTSTQLAGGGGASEEGEENDEQAQTDTTQAPTTPTESPAPSAEIVLSEDCGSAPCGYIQELRHESAVHPNNAAQAADAMAELFRDSRAKIVDHKLYPIGAAVSFTLKLNGWAHRRATLKWSLWSEGDAQEELPKSWWRDVRIARITPTTNRETLFGEFWVPIPPGRGDYAVHLTLDDAAGVAHAGGKSSPIH